MTDGDTREESTLAAAHRVPVPAFLGRRRLRGPVGVKVCGVTTQRDAESVASSGADALGVNFWAGSKRHVAPDDAATWLAALDGRIVRFGVFVNAALAEIRAVIERGLIDVVQLHGDEDLSYCEDVARLGVPVVRAVAVRTVGDLDAIEAAGGRLPRILLLDAYCPGEFGGSGRTCDWELARQAIGRFADRRIILAGGLTPDNVRRAVEQVSPDAVDVASGVESSPGVKDAAAVRRFVEEARAAVPPEA